MGYPFKTINHPDTSINLIQSNIASALNAISGPFVGGNLLTGVAVGTTGTVVNHGLGRVPQVWVICDQDTNTNLKRTAWDVNSLTLIAGSSCVVSLWVN